FGATVTVPAGSSRTEPGAVPAHDLTLSWATFSQAADQAGISRRYGGIHFEQGDLDGRRAGRMVAQMAWDKAQSYLDARLAAHIGGVGPAPFVMPTFALRYSTRGLSILLVLHMHRAGGADIA